jgi:hypothetical protein
VIVDGQGAPLAIDHTGANVHDSQAAIPIVDAIPPIKTPDGGRRKRPDELMGDRAYDAEEKDGTNFVVERSNRRSPSETRNMVAASANIVMSSKHVLAGYSTGDVCESGTRNAMTFTVRSSLSAAA